MSTTINVVCYRNKKLSNGESPLMLRISKDRKSKYKSLGVSINPDYWDFKKNRPKPNCPNRDYILKIILNKENKYQKKVLELKAEDKEFTASTLIEVKTKVKIKTVKEFYFEIVKEMEQSNKIGNSRVYNDSMKSLLAFISNKLDIPFSYIAVVKKNLLEQENRKHLLKL